jgi:hypothetical protein
MVLRSNVAEWGNGCLQKGLAIGRERSGSVLEFGRYGRSEILPRRLDRRGGASVVRRDVGINRMEDLNVKACKEATNYDAICSRCEAVEADR